MHFSRCDATLANVIPEMDDIDETLASMIKDESICPALQSAAALGLRTLNKYYCLTDSAESYHFAMGEYLLRYPCLF